MGKNDLFRQIPKVDVLLNQEAIREVVDEYGKEPVAEILREELDLIRQSVTDEMTVEELQERIAVIEGHVVKKITTSKKANLKRVVNATGVILHTNLGRAPLPQQAMDRLNDQMRGYMNLEFDLETGKRGERYSHFEKLVCKITGAEAAMAVNNNAAAALLMVSAVASGTEVIVSRGEQIEIGGKFRIPEIIELSGATCVEVGTTNKTHRSDYEKAITEQTGALLKVHTSNYKMIGFTESVSRQDMVELGHAHNIPVIEDLGSGVLIDLSRYGMHKEPTVQDSIASGVDVVCFSGDKLFGGPQAGILVGKKEWIERCKEHPYTRAMRIDKCTAAMLETVFQMYEDEAYAVKNIPVLSFIATKVEELEAKAEKFINLLQEKWESKQEITVKHCMNPVGGGSLPGEFLESVACCIGVAPYSATELAAKLRKLEVPIIVRVEEEQLIFDMRTIFEEDFNYIAEEIVKVFNE